MAEYFDLKESRQYEFKPFTVPKYKIQFSNVKRLSNLSQYVWYTPAPIYLWGRYTDINLSDIMAEYELKIYWYRFNRPIFKGLELNQDPAWNHTLWAADKETWAKLTNGILESVQFDVEAKKLYNYALQELVIMDPLQMDQSGIVTKQTDQLKIHAFCPITNKNQIAFSPNRKNFIELPHICSIKPTKRSLYLATRLFENPNLTQDNAFDLYKKLLELEADLSYENKIKALRGSNGRISNSKP